MQWLELKIDAAPAGLEPVSALLEDLGIMPWQILAITFTNKATPIGTMWTTS